MEVTAKACADNDGEGDGEEAHGHIRHCQRHHKVVGDALEIAVEADSPAHQHISSHGQRSNQQLQADVESNCAAIHASCFTMGVVWHWKLAVALIAGPRSSRHKGKDSLSRKAEKTSPLPSYTKHAVSFTPELLVLLMWSSFLFSNRPVPFFLAGGRRETDASREGH